MLNLITDHLQFECYTSLYFILKQIKTMSAVLLRRLLSNIDDFTGVVPAEVQELCKAQLILGVQQEQDQGLRKKIAYAIAELAKCYMGMLKDICKWQMDLNKNVLFHTN